MTLAHGGAGGFVIELTILGVALLVVVIMIVRGNRRSRLGETPEHTEGAKE